MFAKRSLRRSHILHRDATTKRARETVIGLRGSSFNELLAVRANALFNIAVVFFAHDARNDLAWFNCDGLVDDSLLFRVVAHFNMTR